MKLHRIVPLLIFSMLMFSPVAAAAEDFEVASVNGEDADQVNEIDLRRGTVIGVELEGADITSGGFEARIDGESFRIRRDSGEFSPSGVSSGEHSLKIVGREEEADSTRIEVTNITEEKEDRETDDKQESEDIDQESEEDEEDSSKPVNSDFEIESIAGQDADRVNDLDVRPGTPEKRGEIVDVELDGVDFEESRISAFLDGLELPVTEDGIVMVPEIREMGTGEYELKVMYYHESDEGASNASTQVNIENIRDTRGSDISAPGEFTIESIEGEDADQVNKIQLSEGDQLEFELDGIDTGKYSFNAYIDGVEFPVSDEGIEITTDVNEVEEGEHKLRMASTFEGEEATDAETEVKVTEVETRRDRRRPDRLKTELYDEDFDPDVEEMEVERGDGEITVTATGEALESDSGEVVVGDSIEDLTWLKVNYARNVGGYGGAARLKIEEKDPGSVENSDGEVHAVLELSGKNLELLEPTIRYAVENEWADEHGFDEIIRERGGGRENTEIGFYDVENDWKRFDTRLHDSTETHSIYTLQPKASDQELSLESKENTIVIGGGLGGGMVYAEGPQGQCESFESSEEIPRGWTTIEKTCAEMKRIQREREQLRDSINDLKEDLKSDEDRGEKEDLEKLNNSLEELEKGNLDEAEKMYEEVQDKTARGFLRTFIIDTVKDFFSF
ncbi:MAG: hypothetical protein ACLFS3_01885 [Candidatus Aenigmatarchaeota archaeon]